MEKGKPIHSPLFLVRLISISDQNSKISAVIPNKVAKLASQRTRLRRVIYSALEKIQASFKPDFQAVIFAKPLFFKDKKVPDQIMIDAEIKTLFVKAGLLK